jgi:hypothetical protein
MVLSGDEESNNLERVSASISLKSPFFASLNISLLTSDSSCCCNTFLLIILAATKSLASLPSKSSQTQEF